MVKIEINKTSSNCGFIPIYSTEDNELQSASFIKEPKFFSGYIASIEVLPYLHSEENSIIALYAKENPGLETLVRIKRLGIPIVIVKNSGLIEVNSTNCLPTLLYDINGFLERKFDSLHRKIKAEVCIDISYISRIYYGDIKIYYDNNLNFCINYIESTLNELFRLFTIKKNPKFAIYYLNKIDSIIEMTCRNTTFAYKNCLVFTAHSDRHNYALIHELSHIFLYDIGDPPFILKEGIPTIIYDLIKGERRWERYVCNIYTQRRLMHDKEKKLRILIWKYIDSVDSDRIYNGEDYYIAASFVLYIYQKKGFDCLLELYRKLDRKKSNRANVSVLEAIVNENFDSLIEQWITKLKKREMITRIIYSDKIQ